MKFELSGGKPTDLNERIRQARADEEKRRTTPVQLLTKDVGASASQTESPSEPTAPPDGFEPIPPSPEIEGETLLPSATRKIVKKSPRRRQTIRRRTSIGGDEMVPVMGKNFLRRKNPDLPLYTTGFGKGVLMMGAGFTAGGVEASRGLRDRLFNLLLQTNLHPDITLDDVEGLQVTLTLPVQQLVSPGGSMDRCRAAVQNVVETGNFVVDPKLPPGKKDGLAVTIPTPSARREGVLYIRNAGSRTNTLAALHHEWPMAKMNVQVGHMEHTFHALRKLKTMNGEAKVSQEELVLRKMQAQMLRTTNMTLNMNYLTQDGDKAQVNLDVPLGGSHLQFNPDNTLKKNLYEIGGRYLHPALLGLEDWSHITEWQLTQASGGAATIQSSVLEEALMLAPLADDDTRPAISSVVERMLYITTMNGLLPRHPGETCRALFDTIAIVDKEGNPHPDADEITANVLATIIGVPDSSGDFQSVQHPQTYVELVSALHTVFARDGAYIQLRGLARNISRVVQHAKSLPEITKLVEKLGVANPDPVQGEKTPMSIAEFLSSAEFPRLLCESTLMVIAEDKALYHLKHEGHIRALSRLDAIEQVSHAATTEELKHNRAMVDKILRDMRQWRSASQGRKDGKVIGDRIKPGNSDTSADAIPATYRTVPPAIAGSDSSEGEFSIFPDSGQENTE